MTSAVLMAMMAPHFTYRFADTCGAGRAGKSPKSRSLYRAAQQKGNKNAGLGLRGVAVCMARHDAHRHDARLIRRVSRLPYPQETPGRAVHLDLPLQAGQWV